MIRFKNTDDGRSQVTEFTDPTMGTSAGNGYWLGFGFRDGSDDPEEALKTEGGWLCSPTELRAIIRILTKLSCRGTINRIIDRIRFW